MQVHNPTASTCKSKLVLVLNTMSSEKEKEALGNPFEVRPSLSSPALPAPRSLGQAASHRSHVGCGDASLG